jgi:hypothetical protein
MKDKLLQLGIAEILVADDRQENIDAARRYFETLEGIKTGFFRTGREAIAEIKRNYSQLGLVLTDLEMETPQAGVEVALTGYGYLVPSYIITGGPQHRGSATTIKIIPSGLWRIEGTKENPDTWRR